jgi:hypothetical protein
LSADEVTNWNNVMLDAIRVGSMNGIRATRVMAMTHTAIYDAVNSVDDTHFPYHVNLNVPSTTSREAAAAQAAHDVLVNVFPAQQATLATALNNSLSGIPAGPAKTDGIALGSSVAGSIIALRANDHSGDTTPYTPGTLAGQWRPTPPGNAPALLPNWSTVTPWTMSSGSLFRDPVVGPPALSSAAYAAELNEVKAIGAASSTTRTTDQTNIALFWASGGGTSQAVGHFNKIAQTVGAAEGNTLSENARLFALLNLAEADAPIVSWDNKYLFNFWRPVTAIQLADQDGNAATEADPNWLPLLTTPPYPSHSSGLSTVAGAAGKILEHFFGDNISFTTTAPGMGDRMFTSFLDMSQEVADSRMYGGIHFRFEDERGLADGRRLGDHVFATQLRPVPEPGTWLLLVAALLAAMLVSARRTAAHGRMRVELSTVPTI